MLKTVVDAGVPVVVFFAMVVVGMELTADDFRRVARQPGTVVAATVGQFLLLPIIGVFATAYFLAQVPILLAAVVVCRCVWVADGSNASRADNP